MSGGHPNLAGSKSSSEISFTTSGKRFGGRITMRLHTSERHGGRADDRDFDIELAELVVFAINRHFGPGFDLTGAENQR
jgi:hypothetical protein